MMSWLGVLVLVGVLAAVLFGAYIVVGGEFERGRYRSTFAEQCGEELYLVCDERLINALDWYRALQETLDEPDLLVSDLLAGDRAWEPDEEERVRVYVVATAPFLAKIDATEAPAATTATSESELRELAGYVRRACLLRSRFAVQVIRRTGAPAASEYGTIDPAPPLFALAAFALRVPPGTLGLAELSIDLCSEVVAETRLLAELPGAPVLWLFQQTAIEMPEVVDDLGSRVELGIASEQWAVDDRVTVLLERDLLAGGSWRRDWFRLARDGRFAPQLYRGARRMVALCGELRDATTARAAGREARLDELEARAKQPPLSEWDTTRAIVPRTRTLLARWPGFVAHERITRMGLAALVYHREHGTWPRDPSELAKLFERGDAKPVASRDLRFRVDEQELLLTPADETLAAAAWTLRPPS